MDTLGFTTFAISVMTFVFVIYIMSSMVTKKDLERLGVRWEGGRSHEMRRMLEERRGSLCTLQLDDASFAADGIELSGEVVDVDDEWVLVRASAKGGGHRMVAVRLAHVKSLAAGR